MRKKTGSITGLVLGAGTRRDFLKKLLKEAVVQKRRQALAKKPRY
jgi:hypothetical protein